MIEVSPDYAEAHNNLGNLLQDQGKLGEALACLTHHIELAPDFSEAQSARLRCFNFDPKWSPAEICDAHRKWAAARFDDLRPAEEDHGNSREPDRPLRIGYISPDFRVHSVAYFFEALLAAHDKKNFHTIC